MSRFSLAMASTPNASQTILFLAANPQESSPEQLAQEVEAIAQGLQQLPRLHPFQIEQRFVTRPQDMMRAILDVSPQVVHFSGGSSGTPGMVMLDRLFSLVEDQVQCVVLSRCYDQAQGEAIAQHIPFVVGLSAQLTNEIAVEFAVNFYNMLESGRAVELAYKFGCSALQMAGVSEAMTPLFLKRGMVPTTPAPAPAPPPPSASTLHSANQTFNVDMMNMLTGATAQNVVGKGNINYYMAPSPPPETQAPSAALPPEVPAPPFSVASPTVPVAAPTARSPQVPSVKPGEQRQIEVFFSYSHRDEELRDEMAKHLSILKRQGVIKEWYDRDIDAGSQWANEIDDHLNSAQVILLLISPDFMASDYCFEIEMQRALERYKAGEAMVIPVLLRPVDWSGAPFSRIQAFPIVHGGGAKPVTSWANRDEAFENVAKAIRRTVEKLANRV